MKKHKIYVYGTLMKSVGPQFKVPGELFDLGSFPGARIDLSAHNTGPHFIAEVIEASDSELKEFDSYEGYDERNPSRSLYIRRPYLDGWIYEYNKQPDSALLIESGDWQTHSLAKKSLRFNHKAPWREQEEVHCN